jgi:selenocysteine lyase/cysteine desulfurase
MRLFTQHRIEISVAGTDRDLLRLSVASYTTRDEIDRLLAALARELDAEHGQQDE